jgi:hypothetical protein
MGSKTTINQSQILMKSKEEAEKKSKLPIP